MVHFVLMVVQMRVKDHIGLEVLTKLEIFIVENILMEFDSFRRTQLEQVR
jgi:hypothetical protein